MRVCSYSTVGNDDLGYKMLHRAVQMGEKLGLVNDHGPLPEETQPSQDKIDSVRRTAWGLFQIDT